MDPLALGAALAIMGAIVSGLVALYSSSAASRTVVQQRLGGIMGEEQPEQLAAAAREGMRPTRIGRVPIITSLVEGKSWTQDVAEALERGDLKLTVSEYVSIRVMLALLLPAIVMLKLGASPVGLLAMLGAAGAGFYLPSFYVAQAQGKRLKKLEGQLVEMLSLLSNSLKAGFGLMQALDQASRQLEHPIASELRRVIHDTNVGSSIEESLLAMGRRSGSNDLDIIVTAMLVQQSAGGNLSEILDTVAHTMRERIRIRGEIKTLTSQQMLTGFVIGALPLFVAAAFMVVSTSYMMPLITTTLGHIMLLAGGTLEVFGILLIRRILAIEV